MANEIKLGYYTGQTLTYAVYNPDGTEVTAPATSLPEIGSTGYYTATNGDIASGDICIVSDSNGVLFQAEYLPDVVSAGVSAEIAAVDAKIDIIDTNVDTIDGKVDVIDANVDTLIVDQQTVNSNFPADTPTDKRPRIIYL